MSNGLVAYHYAPIPQDRNFEKDLLFFKCNPKRRYLLRKPRPGEMGAIDASNPKEKVTRPDNMNLLAVVLVTQYLPVSLERQRIYLPRDVYNAYGKAPHFAEALHCYAARGGDIPPIAEVVALASRLAAMPNKGTNHAS